MQEADDVVLRGAGDRVARVRLLGGLAQRPLQRHAGVEERDLRAREHHLAQLPLPRGEDVVDELALVLGERLVGRHHVAQLLLRDRRALRLRVTAEQSDDDVGALGQQPDDRARQRGDAVERRGERHGDALRPLQREPLGRQLAEDQREVRDHHRHEDEGQRVRGPGRHACVSEQVRHRHREAGGTERRRQEAGERDADLDRGQEAVGVLDEPGHARPALAPGGERLGLTFAQADERELGGGEDTADEDEDEDEGDVHPGVAHGVHRLQVGSGHAGLEGGSTPSSVRARAPGPARGPGGGRQNSASARLKVSLGRITASVFALST